MRRRRTRSRSGPERRGRAGGGRVLRRAVAGGRPREQHAGGVPARPRAVRGWLACKGRALRQARARTCSRHLAGAPRQEHQRRAPVASPPSSASTSSRCARAALAPIRRSELDSPQAPRSLPKSLSEADVEALLAAPDVGARAGPARSRDAGDALRERAARLGAGGAEDRRGEPGHGRGARPRQGRRRSA